MQKFNKATAGAIAAAVTGLIGTLVELSPETLTAIGTLLAALAVYFAPANKPKHGGGGGP